MRIFKVMDLSTAHLPPRYCKDGPGRDDGVIADEHGDHGWWMWVPEDPDESAGPYIVLDDESGRQVDGPSPALLAIQRYARAQGCDWVLFDQDADQVPDLPAWNW